MTFYCGVDLHSDNHVVVIIDEEDRRLEERRLGNDVQMTLSLLKPYQDSESWGSEKLGSPIATLMRSMRSTLIA